MEHEYKPSPEREKSSGNVRSAFDLQQMEPDRVADLVVILGAASEADFESGKEAFQGGSSLNDLLEHDIAEFPKVDPEKAVELYLKLATHDAAWPRNVVSGHFGGLIRHLPEDSPARTHLIDLWVGLSKDEDDMVREGAEEAIVDSIREGWFDEATTRYLSNSLPMDRQIEIRGRS